jgi:hypothetical protein
MLYTSIPLEQIFPAETGGNTLSQINAYYLGEPVTLLKTGDSYSISRLHSTNPKSYLKSEFIPGAAVIKDNCKLIE